VAFTTVNPTDDFRTSACTAVGQAPTPPAQNDATPWRLRSGQRAQAKPFSLTVPARAMRGLRLCTQSAGRLHIDPTRDLVAPLSAVLRI
jgi:hypothetical protein